MLVFPKASVESSIKYLKSLLPDADWALEHMEGSGGWLALPIEMVQFIELFQVRDYVKLFESESALLSELWQIARIRWSIRQTDTRTNVPNSQDLNRAFDLMVSKAAEIEWDSADGKEETEKETAETKLSKLDFKSQMREIEQAKDVARFGLAMFYNIIALMVHGEKMTSLVERAMGGDDEAYVVAVQVDRNILTGLPFFRDRLAHAQWLGERVFLQTLAYRLSNPILRGKIRYRRLWLALAIIDLLGNLDGSLNAKELLEILDGAGLDTFENRIEDEGYLRKRIAEYRRFQAGRRKRKP